MKILVSGGAGYIGSHTTIALIEAGYDVVVVDNLCNSLIESLVRIEKLSKYKIPFYKIDLRDKSALSNIFKEHSIDGVIHFANLKSVSESFKQPNEYYSNNVGGTFILVDVMREYDCKTLIFSSSASVYGNPLSTPIKEDFPLIGTNPYSRTKIMIEQYLQDSFFVEEESQLGLLRYFNPIGAHKSGLIGENPNGIPNNLVPLVSQVAIGKIKKLNVYGGDYNTNDGTGVRDYIHVIDLAIGHVKALQLLQKKPQKFIANLGTGRGYSVLEVIKTFEKISGKKIPFQIVERRQGDVDICYADCTYANKLLDWSAKYGLEEMCKDAWQWQSLNPKGF